MYVNKVNLVEQTNYELKCIMENDYQIMENETLYLSDLFDDRDNKEIINSNEAKDEIENSKCEETTKEIREIVNKKKKKVLQFSLFYFIY